MQPRMCYTFRMFQRASSLALVLALVSVAAIPCHAQKLAPTPPMGWNSWDAYGLTIDEAAFKANASVLASFRRLGWQYAVIDEGWYMANPAGEKLETRSYQIDSDGLLVPAVNRFPSAQGAAGLRPLAEA